MIYLVPDTFNTGTFLTDCLNEGVQLFSDPILPPAQGIMTCQSNRVIVLLNTPTDAAWAVVLVAIQAQGGTKE